MHCTRSQYSCYSDTILNCNYENALKGRNENNRLDNTTLSSLTTLVPILLLLSLIASWLVFFSVFVTHPANAITPQETGPSQKITGPVKPPVKQSTAEGLGPKIKDFHLKVSLVFSGLKFPSSMAFLGPNDILVLEKNEGTVQRIVNGKLLPEPLLRVPVANDAERGLLGVAIAKNQDGHTYVFLYYTLSEGGVTGDVRACCNVLYRYDFIDNKLVNPKLLLSVPAGLGSLHSGGKIVIGPDGNLYIGVGDLGAHRDFNQNFGNSTEKIGSVIYRISQDGEPVGDVLGDTNPTNKFYAYGIRNTFGIDFDPVTKKLWDSENGPTFGDEINLIEPGFNSGWAKIQGLWEVTGQKAYEVKGPLVADPSNSSSLVDFDSKGKYRSPELVWQYTVGPAGLKFLNSDKLGKEYENDLYVGNVNYGELYHFKLNASRTGLLLKGLHNKVIENPGDNYNFLFGINFGHGITDLQVGPDGYLYVLTIPDWVKQERKTVVGGEIYVIKNR
jgi:aldose sugar dehydrogenase